MSNKKLTPRIPYIQNLDINSLDWSQGVNRIYFQTTRVKLTQNEDGSFAFAWRDRKTKPKEFSAGSVVAAQENRLAVCLGYDGDGKYRAAFNHTISHLTAEQVKCCLDEAANWFTNRVLVKDLHAMAPTEPVEIPTPGDKKRGLLRFMDRSDPGYSATRGT